MIRVDGLCTQSQNYIKQPLACQTCEQVPYPAKRKHLSAISLAVFILMPPLIDTVSYGILHKLISSENP